MARDTSEFYNPDYSTGRDTSSFYDDDYQAPPPPKPMGRVESNFNSFMQGFGQVVSSVPKAIGEGAISIANKFGDDPIWGNPEKINPEETTSYIIGQSVSDYIDKKFPTNEDYQGEFLTDLSAGAGSMGGFLVGGAATSLAKAPAFVGSALFGSAAMGVEQTEDYKRSMEEQGLEVDPETRSDAFLLGSALGTSEAAPIYRALNRIDKITGGGVKKIVKEGVKGGIEELIQEVSQSIGGNAIATDVLEYDPDRDIFTGTVRSGEVGFSLGFLLNTLTSAVGSRRGGRTAGDEKEVVDVEKEVVSNIEIIKPSEFKDVADYNQTIIDGIYDSATELTGSTNTLETDPRKPLYPNDPRANQRKIDAAPEIGSQRTRNKLIDAGQPLSAGEQVDKLFDEALKAGSDNINQYIIDGLYGKNRNIIDHGQQQRPAPPTGSQIKQDEINRREQALGRPLNPAEEAELSAQFPLVSRETESIAPVMDPADFNRDEVELQLNNLYKEAQRLDTESKGQSVPNYIAASGGINWDEAIAQGLDPADMKVSNKKGMPFGKPLFRRTGKTFDEVAELLGEANIQSILETMGAGDYEAVGHSANATLDLVQNFVTGGEPLYMPGDEQQAFEIDADKVNVEGLIEQYEANLSEIDEYEQIQATQGQEAADDFFYGNRALDLYQEMETSGEIDLSGDVLIDEPITKKKAEPKKELGAFPGTEQEVDDKDLPPMLRKQSGTGQEFVDTEAGSDELPDSFKPQAFDGVTAEHIDSEAAKANGHIATDDQIEADNYQKGHIYDLQGMKISIENEAGTKRNKDVPADWPVLAHHYGDIKGTTAPDGDNVDVFIKKGSDIPADNMIYVINQVGKNNLFDENKVMLGFDSAEDAKKGYLDSYSDDFTGFSSIYAVKPEWFLDYLKRGDLLSEFDMDEQTGAFWVDNKSASSLDPDMPDGRGTYDSDASIAHRELKAEVISQIGYSDEILGFIKKSKDPRTNKKIPQSSHLYEVLGDFHEEMEGLRGKMITSYLGDDNWTAESLEYMELVKESLAAGGSGRDVGKGFQAHINFNFINRKLTEPSALAAEDDLGAFPGQEPVEPKEITNVRGRSFAIVVGDNVLNSGSIPVEIDPESEIASLTYYKDMADQVGGDLYLSSTTQVDAPRPDDQLIFGHTWEQIQARQNRIDIAASVESKIPEGAVMVYSSKDDKTIRGDAPTGQTDLLGEDVSVEQAKKDTEVKAKQEQEKKEVAAEQYQGAPDLLTGGELEPDMFAPEKKPTKPSWPPAAERHTNTETYTDRDAQAGEMDSFEIVDDATDVQVEYYYKKNDLAKGPESAPFLMHFTFSGKAEDKYGIVRDIGRSKFVDSNGIDVNVASVIFNVADNLLYNDIQSGMALIGGNIDPGQEKVEPEWEGIVEKEKPVGFKENSQLISDRFLAIGNIDQAAVAKRQAIGEFKTDNEANAIDYDNKRIVEAEGEFNKITLSVESELKTAKPAQFKALLKEHGDNHVVAKSIIDAMLKSGDALVKKRGRYAAVSLIIDNAGYHNAAKNYRAAVSRVTDYTLKKQYEYTVKWIDNEKAKATKEYESGYTGRNYAGLNNDRLLLGEEETTLKAPKQPEPTKPDAQDVVEPQLSDDNYSILSGKKISYDVIIEDTGETVVYTEDAGDAMRTIDGRINALKALQDCIG